MRVLLNSFSSVPKTAALLLTSAAIFAAAPAFAQPAPQPVPAQQQDVLLPDPSAVAPAPGADIPASTALAPDIPAAAAPDPGAMVAPTQPADAAEAQDAMDDLLKKIDKGGQAVKEPPLGVPGDVPEVTPQVVNGAPATPPADTKLAAPGTVTGTPGAAPPAADVPEVPALPAKAATDDNLFFDADTLVPTSEMGQGGPRKVNPALQPASKLIVVKKDYSPNSRQAQLVSAERAVTLGHYDSALEMYDNLYAKNKRDPNIVMGRAVALQHLGKDDEAVQAYQDLLNSHPENIEAQVNMLGLIGQHYPAVGLQRLSDLHEKNPDNVAIIGQMAVLQANLGQYDDAFKSLGMAASMEPHNASHLFNMAVIADRAGKKDEAIKYYEDALETDSVYGGSSSIPRDAVYDRLARLR